MEALNKFNNSNIVKAIKNGLVMSIPALLIGSFALVIMSFPVPAYQEFIKNFGGGFIYKIFNYINKATLGGLSIIMTMTISISYYNCLKGKSSTKYFAVIASLINFFILSGVLSSDFEVRAFGVQGMFIAIFSGILTTRMFVFFKEKTRVKAKLYTDGITGDFNKAMSVIAPMCYSIIICSVFQLLIAIIFKVNCFQRAFEVGLEKMFINVQGDFFGGLLFVFVSTLLWCFGIHGADVLDLVSTRILEANLGTTILSKSFIDTFVLMGGCGTSIALIIAIIIFSKKKATKRMAYYSIIPGVFNINEILIFGVPVVYNIYLIIPFMICPIVCYLIAYGATYFGLIPMVVNQVEWTTPAIYSGYLATGSIVGCAIQVVSILCCVMIYAPFIKMYDKQKEKAIQKVLNDLNEKIADNEENQIEENVTSFENEMGSLARTLSYDIVKAIDEEKIKIYYQPQVTSEGKCVGCEVLLRYNHPTLGYISPVTLVKLANENNYSYNLDVLILKMTTKTVKKFDLYKLNKCKFSVNVDIRSLMDPNYIVELRNIAKEINPDCLCLEITERSAIRFNEKTTSILKEVKRLGFSIAVDDFSVGYTSLKYLQSTDFDIVKLDKSLVQEVEINPRSADIIASIISLSKSMGFSCLSECVETQSQVDELKKLGCDLFQGFNFAGAMELADFTKYFTENN